MQRAPATVATERWHGRLAADAVGMAVTSRRVLMSPETRLPELAMLGWTSQRATDGLGLERHSHNGLWELCWFARGSADWWVGGALHELAAGWCYLTRPDEPHGSMSGLLEACELNWLQFTAPNGRLPGLLPADADSIARALVRAPHAFSAPGLGSLWTELTAALARRDALADVAARTALHRLLLAALATARGSGPAHSPPIARALVRADEGRATVAALARAAGLSRSVFHQRFHAELGDSPAAWLRRRRLRQAKQLLWRSDRAITDIAHACGFATSQRFATAFRESTGLAPQAWRERARTFGG